MCIIVKLSHNKQLFWPSIYSFLLCKFASFFHISVCFFLIVLNLDKLKILRKRGLSFNSLLATQKQCDHNMFDSLLDYLQIEKTKLVLFYKLVCCYIECCIFLRKSYDKTEFLCLLISSDVFHQKGKP